MGEWLFLLGLWLLYGVLINASDLQAFNLQQMGVEALVERGRLSVDGSSTPQLQPRGDVFAVDGHLFAAKQPGQFLAGAVVYAVLHAVGLAYGKHYLLVAALVTWCTASLATAAAAVCVLRLARAWCAPGASPWWPWLAALSFAVGSTALPYAGVAHHDALATASLTGAFFCTWQLMRTAERRRRCVLAAAAGLFLGATVTTSMVAAPMAAVVGMWALVMALLPRPGGPLAGLLLGGALGLAPLLAYNWIAFGNPFLMANVAGNFADTFPFFSASNIAAKVAFYATMVSAYVPVAWCGAVGVALLPPRLWRERLVIAAMLAALLGYLCSIETVGWCQYGPRYLLPAMPFLALGLVGLTALRAPATRGIAVAIALGSAGYSTAVNLTGALYGAMYCDPQHYGFAYYLAAMGHGEVRAFPLALWLTVPCGLWLVAVVRAYEARAR